MTTQKRAIVAVIAGSVATGAVVGVASIPHCDDVAALLLPGILLAALVFAQGIHSDHAIAFMILAGVLNVLIYGMLAFFGAPACAISRAIGAQHKSLGQRPRSPYQECYGLKALTIRAERSALGQTAKHNAT